VARQHRRSLSLKFTNTLVVKNHKQVFSDDTMYLSGAPLHVLAMNLVRKFRAHMPEPIPISFSGGLDANNMAAAVAMNFVPVTTCTDLLRPGGYARMIRYLEKLGAEMQRIGVSNLADFVLNYRGQAAAAAGNVHTAGLLNTPILVAEATANPRYSWERNQGVPRKIGSKLWLYDCINCDKCVPVCPNDANFSYETQPATIEYDNFELLPAGEVRPIPGGVLRVMKAHQLANYADACNDCGNCDIFCPEDGGPQVEKPRFFGNRETYKADAGANGFYIDWEARTIHGMLAHQSYVLSLDAAADRGWFHSAGATLEIRLSDNQVLGWQPKDDTPPPPSEIDMQPYFKLKLLMKAIGDPRRVHFANVAALSGEHA
jgi:putative selenate reductase